MEHAVIMAGGSGTRLWPLSRRGMPKQLLRLFEGRSLLQMAHHRASSFIDPTRILVCASRAYRDVIIDQLPDLPVQNLLLEPVGRDSLPAAAWSAATIASRDPQAVVALLTADHVIAPMSKFRAAMTKALATVTAHDEVLVTLGIEPTSPHTGYGYLHIKRSPDSRRVFEVTRFTEKPSLELARQLLDQGDWWWNSGMSCWRADVFLRQIAHFQPAMADAIDRLVEHPDLIDDIYPDLTRISIDYAIMEPVSENLSTARILALPLRADWIDIGHFPALAQQLAQSSGNAAQGPVVMLNSSGNLILNRNSDRLIAVSGLTDMIVVQDHDVTLVCPKDQAESIKQLVELVRVEAEQYL